MGEVPHYVLDFGRCSVGEFCGVGARFGFAWGRHGESVGLWVVGSES